MGLVQVDGELQGCEVAAQAHRCLGEGELQVLDRRQATPSHLAGVELGMYPGAIGQLGVQALLQAQPCLAVGLVLDEVAFRRAPASMY